MIIWRVALWADSTESDATTAPAERPGAGVTIYSHDDTPTLESQTGAPRTASDAESDGAREVQVLEFKLGSERYCVDIDFVSEIVDKGALTRVPNAPHYVDGVMGLRGRTTSIINPKALLSIAEETEGKRTIIFDPGKFEDEAAVGWVVDEVYQVIRVSMDDVEDPPLDDGGPIEGIVKREDDDGDRRPPEESVELFAGDDRALDHRGHLGEEVHARQPHGHHHREAKLAHHDVVEPRLGVRHEMSRGPEHHHLREERAGQRQ